MIILIADDDRLIRFTVKSMLAEIMKSEYAVIEAANGKEMVELCKKYQPDIVFTDIKMPFMNGLEAIEEAKKDTKKAEFVIISGYSDFEYAKKGIHLGVHDYLLKPVEEEQLEEVMDKLTEKLNKKKRDTNAEFKLKLLDMFNYFSTAGITEEYVDFTLPEDFAYFVVGMFTGIRKEQEKIEVEQAVVNKAAKIGETNTLEGGYYAQIYSDEGTPYFIYALPKEKMEYLLSRIRSLKVLQKERWPAIFYYFCCKNMEEIYRKTEQLDKEFFVGMNYPQGNLLNMEQVSVDKETFCLLELIYGLLNAWRAADGIRYKEILNEMYRTYKDCSVELNLKEVASYCTRAMGMKMKGDSFKEFCRSFVDFSDTMYENVFAEENDLIEQIKKDIQENYMKDISISQLADKYHLTANYLSTIFHNKTGSKFIDYLTETRVYTAKSLLIKNATASVQDIAMMVGYNSARHFSTVFQKQTGVTPTAYRKNS